VRTAAIAPESGRDIPMSRATEHANCAIPHHGEHIRSVPYVRLARIFAQRHIPHIGLPLAFRRNVTLSAKVVFVLHDAQRAETTHDLRLLEMVVPDEIDVRPVR